jgi:hypothetical protein
MKRMNLLYLTFILFLGCSNNRDLDSRAESLPSTVPDTTFHRYFPDTTGNITAVNWDYRYFLRTQSLLSALRLPNIEEGVNGFELRLWQLSSWNDKQDLFILKKNADSLQLFHYDFNVRTETWDNPNVKVSKLKKTGSSQISSGEITSLHVDSLRKYPSMNELRRTSFNSEPGSSICIEIAEKYRYKFAFFLCPEINTDSSGILKNIVSLHRNLIELDRKH